METLVVAQHGNQDYSRIKSNGPAQFLSSPSKQFREINCRTFQSGAGILPTPFKDSTTPLTKCLPSSPKTPLSAIRPNTSPLSVGSPCHKAALKSSSIPINIKFLKREARFNKELCISDENFPFSERWAGPAYSNSPPPSSLPIPKFSMRAKRTTSLELPVSDCGVKVHPVAKSAPASPTRDYNPPSKNLFLSTDRATKTLRRILNLKVADE